MAGQQSSSAQTSGHRFQERGGHKSVTLRLTGIDPEPRAGSPDLLHPTVPATSSIVSSQPLWPRSGLISRSCNFPARSLGVSGSQGLLWPWLFIAHRPRTVFCTHTRVFMCVRG